MRLRIDAGKCQGHARCYSLAPDLFEVDEYGIASVRVDEVPEDRGSQALLAIANCPELAIEVVTGTGAIDQTEAAPSQS